MTDPSFGVFVFIFFGWIVPFAFAAAVHFRSIGQGMPEDVLNFPGCFMIFFCGPLCVGLPAVIVWAMIASAVST